MKEEKNSMNSNEEEKMKLKFRRLRKIVQWIESLLLVIPILVILLTFLSIGVLVGENVTDEEVIDEGTTEISTVDDEGLNLVDTSSLRDFRNETINNIASVVAIAISLADWILSIMLLKHLEKVFYEVENKGTPFTDESVMHVDKISKLTLILGIIRIISAIISTTGDGGVGLIFVIIILAISSIFKYGYKLQKESDETL